MQATQAQQPHPSSVIRSIANILQLFLGFFYYLNTPDFHRDLEIVLFGEVITVYDDPVEQEPQENTAGLPEASAGLGVR